MLNRLFTFLGLCCANVCFGQNHISFRNTLNEANFWFYEADYDSALFYYQKAEKFNLAFYPEEVHLYSRNLWELNYKTKSIEILEKGGFDEFFEHDTTFYLDLPRAGRKEILAKLKSSKKELWYTSNFYDSTRTISQNYRTLLDQFYEGSKQSDSLKNLISETDSLHFLIFINKIKTEGYPGGYKSAPVGPYRMMSDANPKWLLSCYHIFQKEIEEGRMSLYDFSQAIDKMFVFDEKQSPYNSLIPQEEKDVSSPIMVYVNRCLIGMSPYYDIYIPKMYKRGQTPRKSKLYEFYKRSKQDFNCTWIK